MSEAAGSADGHNNDNGSGAGPASADSPDGQRLKAPKDRSCPFCAQPFTSSSLGRHLDLYIKEKNPKPPDGIHDVEAIRKMRGTITRRQPRGSLARRDASTPGTPTASVTRKSPDSAAGTHASAIPKEGHFVVDQTPRYPWQASWEATGVINDIPSKNRELADTLDDQTLQSVDSARRSGAQQRVSSRAAQKQQLDARQKLADAMDTARAAELALRELLSSWRAAKQQISMNSLPFEFDPLALDFPALTLQCLQPPPTLFSSMPHPTSTSWSIQPPAQKQYDALETWFQEEFRKWRVACAAATTASYEDLTYPPSRAKPPVDLVESLEKASKATDVLEKQVAEHLQSTYAVWQQLPPQRQQELWTLELARSVGRRQKEVEELKQTKHSMTQQNTNLQSQIDQLNRLQQPKEFRIMPPTTIPFDQAFVAYCLDLGVQGRSGTALNINDRHVDLNALISHAIERWKHVIISSRNAGLSNQKSLDQVATLPASAVHARHHTQGSPSNHATPTPTPIAAPPPTVTSAQQQQQQQPHSRSVSIAANMPVNNVRSTVTPATSTSAGFDENSDEDADAEMEDDDSFAPTTTPVVAKPSPRQLQPLQVPRAREHPQRGHAQFAVNGTANMAANQGMPVIQPGSHVNSVGMQSAVPRGQPGNRNEFASVSQKVAQGVGSSDSMYVD